MYIDVLQNNTLCKLIMAINIISRQGKGETHCSTQ